MKGGNSSSRDAHLKGSARRTYSPQIASVSLTVFASVVPGLVLLAFLVHPPPLSSTNLLLSLRLAPTARPIPVRHVPSGSATATRPDTATMASRSNAQDKYGKSVSTYLPASIGPRPHSAPPVSGKPWHCSRDAGADLTGTSYRRPSMPRKALIYSSIKRKSSLSMLRRTFCPALPCPALPCPALPCPALPCPPMLCNAMQRNAMRCPALQCNAMLCNATQYRALPYPAPVCHFAAVEPPVDSEQLMCRGHDSSQLPHSNPSLRCVHVATWRPGQ